MDDHGAGQICFLEETPWESVLSGFRRRIGRMKIFFRRRNQIGSLYRWIKLQLLADAAAGTCAPARRIKLQEDGVHGEVMPSDRCVKCGKRGATNRMIMIEVRDTPLRMKLAVKKIHDRCLEELSENTLHEV